jgi:hypothetical protein
MKSFNLMNQDFFSSTTEDNHNIINNSNIINYGTFYNFPNILGYRDNINNIFNIKNVNIINYKDSSFFNNDIKNNNNHNLFNKINTNNSLKTNKINNEFYKYNELNHFINFSQVIENNKNIKLENYIKKRDDVKNICIQKENSIFYYNNNIVDLNKINLVNDNNQERNEFIYYVNQLKMPLTKFLSTKKGIYEFENYLKANNYKDINLLLKLLNKDGISKLMKNKFGNYLMQDIIKISTNDQVELILDLISDNFIEISENISGTYVIQTLLEKLNTSKLHLLVLKLIENRELEMAFNNNATYVLQKIIEKIPDFERLNLNEIIINNLYFLSINPDCIFIVEKFIDTITIQYNKIRILNIIYINCLQLSNNPYGNYLIQYILKVWKNENIQIIHDIIIQNANYLVQQRYASNVIEKCFQNFDNKNRKRLVRSICLEGDILNVIKNQYGHYVLNKTIKYIDNDLKKEIEIILNNKMSEMNKKEKSKSKKFISILNNIKITKKK